jgi:hypothetical protein
LRRAWSAASTNDRNLPRRNRRAFHTVEVRLVVFVELLRLIVVEVLAALDQDRALI